MPNDQDPIPDTAAPPTLYEWAGGLPALNRMTRLFYERHVPADSLIGPLFADMAPDHPERVAAWLGEVFGGPKFYSEQYGGMPMPRWWWVCDAIPGARSWALVPAEDEQPEPVRVPGPGEPVSFAGPADRVETFRCWVDAAMPG